jgi:hypothetical protein
VRVRALGLGQQLIVDDEHTVGNYATRKRLLNVLDA